MWYILYIKGRGPGRGWCPIGAERDPADDGKRSSGAGRCILSAGGDLNLLYMIYVLYIIYKGGGVRGGVGARLDSARRWRIYVFLGSFFERFLDHFWGVKTDKSSVRVIDFEVLSIPENASKKTSKMTPKKLNFYVIFR